MRLETGFPKVGAETASHGVFLFRVPRVHGFWKFLTGETRVKANSWPWCPPPKNYKGKKKSH